VGAKVHPAPGRTADELAIALDGIDHALRQELPEVAEVFIDLTSHRAGSPEGQPGFSPVNRGNLDNNRSVAPRNVLVGARASDIAT
jgi:hypothetical protein